MPTRKPNGPFTSRSLREKAVTRLPFTKKVNPRKANRESRVSVTYRSRRPVQIATSAQAFEEALRWSSAGAAAMLA